jgi:hypothetical protein
MDGYTQGLKALLGHPSLILIARFYTDLVESYNTVFTHVLKQIRVLESQLDNSRCKAIKGTFYSMQNLNENQKARERIK